MERISEKERDIMCDREEEREKEGEKEGERERGREGKREKKRERGKEREKYQGDDLLYMYMKCSLLILLFLPSCIFLPLGCANPCL